MPYQREAVIVLEMWRDVERVPTSITPGSDEEEELRAEAARLRNEYQRLIAEAENSSSPIASALPGMTGRDDPARNRLRDAERLDELDAEHWIARWEREAEASGRARDDQYWSDAWEWITEQRRTRFGPRSWSNSRAEGGWAGPTEPIPPRCLCRGRGCRVRHGAAHRTSRSPPRSGPVSRSGLSGRTGQSR